jgi:hypothetical protein
MPEDITIEKRAQVDQRRNKNFGEKLRKAPALRRGLPHSCEKEEDISKNRDNLDYSDVDREASTMCASARTCLPEKSGYVLAARCLGDAEPFVWRV